jgi:hypothetical protein
MMKPCRVARLTSKSSKVSRAGRRGTVVVAGDQPAKGDPGVEVEAGEDRIHDLAADILKVDVDAVRGGGLELLAPVLGAVVDGRVEAELLGEDRTLLRAAGDADDAGAIALGELAGNRADRAGGRRDDDRLTLLRLADFPSFRPRP